MTPTFTRDEILELATEYRPSMPEEVLHLWAKDVVYVLQSLMKPKEPSWYRYKFSPGDEWWASGPNPPNLAKFPRSVVEPLYEATALIPQPIIKPLQWEKHPYADMWRAFTIVGVYTVSTIIDVLWVFDGYENGCQDAVDARDELDAKAACQADFNDRIKSVLERPNPSLT